MIERASGIYEVTLRSGMGKGVGEIRIYVIPGTFGGRSLMIDTGFGEEGCLEQMERELERMRIPASKLDIFLTHKHHDHCGLASVFAERGARLFMNPDEDRHHYDCLYYHKSHDAMEEQVRVLGTVGVTQEMTPEIWQKFMEINERVSGRNERWAWVIRDYPYEPVRPGQVFRYGEYVLRAMALKGHTYGQMGLYDNEKKVLFTADQVINGIVPIVGTTHVDEHLLEGYFESLQRLKHEYKEYLILPAHRGPIWNVEDVIEGIARAYLNKLEIIGNIIADTDHPLTVAAIAARAYGMEKEPANDDEFIKLKMVISKTFSCLEFLYARGLAERTWEKGTLYWIARNPSGT